MDRRSFTKGLLGSIFTSAIGADRLIDGALVSSAPTAIDSGRNPNSLADYDIAVIGGGVSGIYAAWRLITANPHEVIIDGHSGNQPNKLRVAVFEGSHRVGGRLLSASHDALPGVRCELGGMRFLSSQKRIKALVKKLGLGAREMNMTGNIAFLRGKYLSWQDLNNPDLLPYKLENQEKQWIRENGAGALMTSAVRQLLPKIGELHGEQLYNYLKTAEFEGKPLFKWGFRDLLTRIMSSEALSLAMATGGFDALGENANAVDLIVENTDFIPGTTFFLLKDGFESVPWALQEKFEQAGGKVVFGHWLSHFEVVPGAGGTRIKLKFNGGCDAITVRALVLAMPQHCLKLLLSSFSVAAKENQDRFASLFDSVESIPLFKMFILYPRPWWQEIRMHEKNICVGRSYTDGPVRQCWYWNSIGCGNTDSNAMIMAYCDMSSVQFWERFRPKDAGRLSISEQCNNARPAEFVERRLLQNWSNHQVPSAMLNEMHRQLLMLHGVGNQHVPGPIAGAYKDWCDEPYGCAVHYWNRGVKSWELADVITKPIRDVDCYICGEAYSTNQTWVEGALETADRVLRHFGLAPPLN